MPYNRNLELLLLKASDIHISIYNTVLNNLQVWLTIRYLQLTYYIGLKDFEGTIAEKEFIERYIWLNKIKKELNE